MENAKAKLYRKVQKTRDRLGITGLDYPLPYLPDLIAAKTDIYIRETKLVTPGLRGMTVCDPETGALAMLLDLSASKEIRQFAAAHELMHCEHHPIALGSSFQSYDTVSHKQNRFLEWEANEGAAELIMPYQHFIPFFFTAAEYYGGMIRHAVECMANYYSVSIAAIDHRITSLKYELNQYSVGVPVHKIELLSGSAQKKQGKKVPKNIEAIFYLWLGFGRYYA